MAKRVRKSTPPYINRELSWLEFNDRVLQEGLCEDLPLLERLKFLSIVSSNLDEFFLVRVAGLMQQRSARILRHDPSGMTASRQIAAIAGRAHRMVGEQSEGIHQVLHELAEHGLHILVRDSWTEDEKGFLESYFTKEILAVLTPLAMQKLDPCPLLQGLQLHVAGVLEVGGKDAPEERIVVVPVPSGFPRFIAVPSEEGLRLALLEDVICEHLAGLFGGCKVLATSVFRITRDADVAILQDQAGDLLYAVEQAVLDRRRRSAVRLEISTRSDRRIRNWLADWLKLKRDDVYRIKGIMDAKALMQVATRQGFDDLKFADQPPQPPRDLAGEEDLWSALQDHDVMLFHPYESFDPVVQLVEQAAEDPGVLAIKQTLYRTSGDSPIIHALQRAAAASKDVTVLVELTARFDEARNVTWARQLEDAGCHVIYGIAGLKTHAKVLLIIRREEGRIRRYVHLATGNYNDKTAKLYSDIGLMTSDRDLASDVAAFFNLLTGYSEMVGWSKLSVAPTGLKQRFVDLIEREVQASTADRPGLIMAKINSLQDPDVIEALYRASQSGVKIMLNVRGICCLRPGVKGLSENIEVRSIIDRYLEHARIFYFRNGGHEEVYLSSADWMRRNLEKRLEILFPIKDRGIRRRLIDALKTYFTDNVKSRVLLSDGTYEPVVRKGRRVRAQEKFYNEAIESARVTKQTAQRFRPLTRPEK